MSLLVQGWKRLGLRGRDVLLIYIPVAIVAAVVASVAFIYLPERQKEGDVRSVGQADTTNGLPPSPNQLNIRPGPTRLQPVSSAREILVASVNGEQITLADLRQRADLDKVLYLLSSHANIDFQSEDGRATLVQIQAESLDNLVGEKLVEQFARQNPVTVDLAEVDAEITRLLAANNVTREQMTAALNAQNLQFADFAAMIEKVTMLNKFVNQVVVKDVDEDHQDLAAKGWFDDAYDEANIRLYYNPQAPQDDSVLKDAQSSAEAYAAQNQLDGAIIKVMDLGSHVQVDIFVADHLVRELVYMGAAGVTEIKWG